MNRICADLNGTTCGIECHPEQLIKTVKYDAEMYDIEFSPDGSMYAVAADRRKTAAVFDAKTHKLMWELCKEGVSGNAVDFMLKSQSVVVTGVEEKENRDGWLFVVE